MKFLQWLHKQLFPQDFSVLNKFLQHNQYLYRAVDSDGHTLDFLLTGKREQSFETITVQMRPSYMRLQNKELAVYYLIQSFYPA